jgi:membrane-associated phospholipid phosphatase
MLITDPEILVYWQFLTRLGEAQVLLPAALLTALAVLRRPQARPLAARWLLLLGAGALFTTATKVAFFGWGVGWAELNFTGVSGHAMFAAAVYPVLFGALASSAPPKGRLLAIAGGCSLALLIGVSRIVVGAHSLSEVLAGCLVGGTVSALVLSAGHLPRTLVGPVLPVTVIVVVWLGLMPAHAPASTTHSAVIRLSLKLSGNSVPYTRGEMLRGLAYTPR